MGSCVSSHRISSTMKVRISSGSNRKPDDHDVVIPCSPIKEKAPIINDSAAVNPQWVPLRSTADSRDIGSTDETFFDSQAWLDSDCESDFMSVNGEFTLSSDNTPVHHNFPTGPLQKGGAPAIDDHKPSMTLFKPSPSPVMNKKRLSELFSESQRESCTYDDENGENATVRNLEVAAVRGGGLKPKRERWVEIVQVRHCLPRYKQK